MAKKPNRSNTPLIVFLILLIIASIAATALVIWLCIDMASSPAEVPKKPSASQSQTAGTTAPKEPEETVPPTTTEPPAPEHVVSTATISTQGDLLMHTGVFGSAKQSDGSYDFENIFRYVTDTISSFDYAIANLETTFGGPKHPHQPNLAFSCPDELAADAKKFGYDMFLTANNHSGDAAGDGLIRTIEVTREAGLANLGSQMPGEPRYTIVEVNGIKIGMTAYTWAYSYDGNKFSLNGLAGIQDEGQMNFYPQKNPDKLYKEAEQIMAEMIAAGAEATMIHIHWGVEYGIVENQQQNQIAQKLCDMGFDVIVGGHAHVVQPMELLQSSVDPDHKTVCIYSLGNAVSNQRTGISEKFPPGYTEDGVIFITTFEKYSDGTVYLADVDLIPTWVNMHSNHGKKEYNILPLEIEKEDQWQTTFEMTDNNFTSCQKSYERTMGIVTEGLEACRTWLEQQKLDREDYYYNLAFFPERFAAKPAETLPNAA